MTQSQEQRLHVLTSDISLTKEGKILRKKLLLKRINIFKRERHVFRKSFELFCSLVVFLTQRGEILEFEFDWVIRRHYNGEVLIDDPVRLDRVVNLIGQ